MALKLNDLAGSFTRARATRRWKRLANTLRRGGRLPDKSIRNEAAELHRELSALLQLSHPDAIRARSGLAGLPMLPGTDWCWRPAIFLGPTNPPGGVRPTGGQRLGEEIAIWHDCSHRALMVRQVQNRKSDDLVPFGLGLDFFGFTGSYASLSIDLPQSVLDGLARHHVIQIRAELLAETPIKAYGRINLVQGPNIENMVREMGDPVAQERCERIVEFDLSFADLAPRPIERVWVDLVFSMPYMNAISVADLVLSRHPRSEI